MSRDTLERFYGAFAARDAEQMSSCYAPTARFTDPVFRLDGEDIGDMWRMLIERGPDLGVDHDVLDPTHARWTARYRFKGRPVVNAVRSSFRFDNRGMIVEQVDEFDFPRWAGQALGWKGRLFGRTAFLRHAVQRSAEAGLRRWQERRAAGGPARPNL